MGKRLAIKGHLTRGNEVIEMMQMMGGSNIHKHTGNNKETFYYIDDRNDIDCDWTLWNNNRYTVFTLEEFLEKYPFKIDDKVFDKADGCPGVVCEMKWDEDVSDMKYFVAFGNGIDFGWYVNDSIDFCKENENLVETQSKRDIDKSDFIIKHMILPNKMDDKLEYEIIDGYEFDRVENNKIILKPIKPKYPTNYQECCDVLGLSMQNALIYINKDCNKHNYYNDLQSTLNCFVSLKICRDAYWKIAGEQMGLDSPWKPDWKNTSQIKHSIWFDIDGICIKSNRLSYTIQHILSFPTTEMRDAFYENFKGLIEQCKELL